MMNNDDYDNDYDFDYDFSIDGDFEEIQLAGPSTGSQFPLIGDTPKQCLVNNVNNVNNVQ